MVLGGGGGGGLGSALVGWLLPLFLGGGGFFAGQLGRREAVLVCPEPAAVVVNVTCQASCGNHSRSEGEAAAEAVTKVASVAGLERLQFWLQAALVGGGSFVVVVIQVVCWCCRAVVQGQPVRRRAVLHHPARPAAAGRLL